MGKIYETKTEAALIEFCLNCTRGKCYGGCEALKKEKQRITKNKKRSIKK